MLECLAGWSGGLSVRAGGDCVGNGRIFGAAMAEKKQENGKVRCSAAYPTDAPEKLCFGGKPHEVRPKGPQGAARGAWAAAGELLCHSYCVRGV